MGFIHDDFLLKNEAGRRLYHDYAADMPIYDYHCHLPVEQIAENTQFRNAYHIWLGGDHYKWRVMRSLGIPENEITGGTDEKQKFMKWAEAVPYAVGNPVYHWTHLEMKRIFGINQLLSPKTAESIWDEINEKLVLPEFSARSIAENCNVRVICTTDDPADDLRLHRQIRDDKSFGITLAPAMRPDAALNIEQGGFQAWLDRLRAVSGRDISGLADLTSVLEGRIDFFHETGCRISDHALDGVVFAEPSEKIAERAFSAALAGRSIDEGDLAVYKSWLMTWFGWQFHRREWSMQLHIGAMRRVNSRMTALIGPDTGFDSIADGPVALPLGQLLDSLDRRECLPRTILYCLNPRDNEVLATMLGNFQGDGIKGKIQFGSGWWFNDQKDGMIRQLTALSNLGVLSTFVGMLTDSRSFLSYPRHEYFRRILCNLMGTWVEEGEYPRDMAFLGGIVKDICYRNAEAYFRLPPNRELK